MLKNIQLKGNSSAFLGTAFLVVLMANAVRIFYEILVNSIEYKHTLQNITDLVKLTKNMQQQILQDPIAFKQKQNTQQKTYRIDMHHSIVIDYGNDTNNLSPSIIGISQKQGNFTTINRINDTIKTIRYGLYRDGQLLNPSYGWQRTIHIPAPTNGIVYMQAFEGELATMSEFNIQENIVFEHDIYLNFKKIYNMKQTTQLNNENILSNIEAFKNKNDITYDAQEKVTVTTEQYTDVYRFACKGSLQTRYTFYPIDPTKPNNTITLNTARDMGTITKKSTEKFGLYHPLPTQSKNITKYTFIQNGTTLHPHIIITYCR